MNYDLNTAQTASSTILVGADRKDPPEKWVLPMVRSTVATSISPWASATFWATGIVAAGKPTKVNQLDAIGAELAKFINTAAEEEAGR